MLVEIRKAKFTDEVQVPVLGQGTWRMGEDPTQRKAEVEALRLGIDLGMTLIDTAEMYADAESVVGEAIAGRRDDVFLVSKVLPENASRQGCIHACERSLGKLGTDCIDLYLLHWESPYPLEETLSAFVALREAGKIKEYGVSNFDTRMIESALALDIGERIASNQMLYNLMRRGPESHLIPSCRKAKVLVMAYSPLEQARMKMGTVINEIAQRHAASPAQIAIAWTLRTEGVIVIPKASKPEHIRENADVSRIRLDERDLKELDRAYPRQSDALEYL